MEKYKGTKCRLLGNPPRHYLFTNDDRLDGKFIAVSAHVTEYHAPGSLIPRGTKLGSTIFHHGGLLFHVYRRKSARSDAFTYFTTNIQVSRPEDDERFADKDYDAASKLTNARQSGRIIKPGEG